MVEYLVLEKRERQCHLVLVGGLLGLDAGLSGHGLTLAINPFGLVRGGETVTCSKGIGLHEAIRCLFDVLLCVTTMVVYLPGR